MQPLKWRKDFGLFFSRDFEHAKLQGTVCKGSQSILAFILQMICTFICHLRGRLKQTFRKTAVFTMKEDFGPFFRVISSVTNLEEQFIIVHQLFWQLLWKLLQLKEHFLGPKRLLKTKIFEKKKATYPVKKNFGLFFSRDIEHAKSQGTVYRGSQGVLTFISQMICTFICHLRGRLKQTFRKTAVFTMKEDFGPFFRVISSVTNLKEQL